MPLVGGGGAGNTAGSTFTGSSQGLEIIGDFAYSYNQVSSDALQGPTNTLSFTTGNYTFIGHWTACGTVNKDGASSTGGIAQFYLKLNSTTVMSLKTDTAEEDQPQHITVPVIIPPFTKVEALIACTVNNANWLASNSLTGRIYV